MPRPPSFEVLPAWKPVTRDQAIDSVAPGLRYLRSMDAPLICGMDAALLVRSTCTRNLQTVRPRGDY